MASIPELRRRTPPQLARAVRDGRGIGEALRHLDQYGSEPGSAEVAEALARLRVARCQPHDKGWQMVRQVVVDASADAPWEKCARRAIPDTARDHLDLSVAR